MKKTTILLALMLICVLALTGCQCEHQWTDADCTTPKTCTVCEETEGAPTGHSWLAATCITPKTCEICKTTDGKALDHKWVDATCTAPKTCESCKVTNGDATGHEWLDATTETPKSCAICHTTEGERIITDPRFKTATAKQLFGSWELREEITAESLGLPAMEGTAAEISVYEYNNDGTIKIYGKIENRDVYISLMEAANAQNLYDYYAQYGMNKDQAEQAIQQGYGMTFDEYVTERVMSAISFVESMSIEGVYYVDDDGNVYSGPSWDSELEREDIVLDGDTLTLVDSEGDSVTLTRG